MKILLGVTGSVAAKLTPNMVEAFVAAGHEVRIVATASSFYFWNVASPAFARTGTRIYTEKDEWPGGGYVKGQEVPHIALRDWADVLVLAPLTANTMAKMAAGITDNLLTSIIRAWDPEKPIVIAPAMNTKMWEHPLTARHLREIKEIYANVTQVGPVAKMLACGDVGMGAMAPIEEIVASFSRQE